MKKTISLYYCLFLTLAFFTSCDGQFKNGEDGLGTQLSEYLVTVFEDSKGNLWFGSMAKGAMRYNPNAETGEDPLVYFTISDGIPGMTVSSFTEDKKGNVWIGGHAGVCFFDGKKITVVQRSAGIPTSGWGWMGVYTDDKGEIVVSSRTGLYQYVDAVLPSNEPGLMPYVVPEAVKNVEVVSFAIVPGKYSEELIDSKGNTWYSVEGAGLYKVTGDVITHFSKKDGLCSNNINSVIEDKSGNIWIACMQSYQPEMTYDGGVCRYNPSETGKAFTQYPDLEGLNKNDIYTIYVDRDGIVWIGALGVGIYRYDGKEFTVINKSDRSDLITRFGLQDMLEDSKGTKWLGFSGGLFRLEGDSIINVTQEDLRSLK